MQKVIGINLNGNAYQLEEPGYDALLAYLDDAETQLAENPDRSEIIADLEQAIADKCDKVLGPHKTVVTASEVERIIKDMGPVEGGRDVAEAAAAEAAGKKEERKADASAPKRLYQIREGAFISGVCKGIAAYLNVDVTIVRIVFVILAVLTKGVWIIAYIILMFVIPYATTSEERAVAHGRPFNAKDIIEQAKRDYSNFKSKDWKRHWKQQRRQWKRQWRQGSPIPPENVAYATQVLAGATAPLFGLINLALVILMMIAIVSVVSTHAVFGWPLPDRIPVWVGLLVIVLAYQTVAAPFIYANRAGARAYDGQQLVLIAPWAGTLWLLIIVLFMWYGYHYVPVVHDFIQQLPSMWSNLLDGDR